MAFLQEKRYQKTCALYTIAHVYIYQNSHLLHNLFFLPLVDSGHIRDERVGNGRAWRSELFRLSERTAPRSTERVRDVRWGPWNEKIDGRRCTKKAPC
jgi:hypothetical protein